MKRFHFLDPCQVSLNAYHYLLKSNSNRTINIINHKTNKVLAMDYKISYVPPETEPPAIELSEDDKIVLSVEAGSGLVDRYSSQFADL